MKLTPFGKEVRKVRIDHGHMLKDMADTLSVSPAFLSSVETGRKPVPPSLIDKIVAAYALDRQHADTLSRAAALSRDEFSINLRQLDSKAHREVAAVLARSFPTMTEYKLNRLRKLLDDEDEQTHE